MQRSFKYAIINLVNNIISHLSSRRCNINRLTECYIWYLNLQWISIRFRRGSFPYHIQSNRIKSNQIIAFVSFRFSSHYFRRLPVCALMFAYLPQNDGKILVCILMEWSLSIAFLNGLHRSPSVHASLHTQCVSIMYSWQHFHISRLSLFSVLFSKCVMYSVHALALIPEWNNIIVNIVVCWFVPHNTIWMHIYFAPMGS